MSVIVKMDTSALKAVEPSALKAAIKRAINKAGSTALRDMRSEANKQIRSIKAIPLKYIRDAITVRRDASHTEWSLEFSGKPVPLSAYPHRQGKRGVTVTVNKGKRRLLPRTFVATMRSGHQGIFKRSGTARLPINELLGSRPSDALLTGDAAGARAVAERGLNSLKETYVRLLALEIGGK